MRAPADWTLHHAADGQLVLTAQGDWTAACAGGLEVRIDTLDPPMVDDGEALVDMAQVSSLDGVGVWAAAAIAEKLESAGWSVAVEAGERSKLFGQLYAAQRLAEADGFGDRRSQSPLDRLARFGFGVQAGAQEAGRLLGFVGLAAETAARMAANPRRFRLRATLDQVDRIGVTAAPIIAILMFFVGVVMAYQGVAQLRRFGLVGLETSAMNGVAILMLREFGVLITSILVAGRSGSAFCAEIGFMKANEEIDAMRAMAIDPVEALILPRLFGALIALPLLTVLADVAGVFGGAVYMAIAVDMTGAQIIERVHFAILPETFLIGVAKAPVFAAIIALVGCYKGVSAVGGAEAVGRKTTEAVVLSIFLVIVANAGFSIAFAVVGL